MRKKEKKKENTKISKNKKISVYFYINIFLSFCIFFIALIFVLNIFNLNLKSLAKNIDFRDFFKTQNYKNINEENNLLENTINLDQDNARSESKTEPDETKKEEVKKEVKIIGGMYSYLKVKDSCGAHFGGVCARARSCPGLSCPVVTSIRDGMILRTDGETIKADGIIWYHVIFDEWVRYPERTAREWYISSDFVENIEAKKEKFAKDSLIQKSENKEIIINRTKQKLYAYEGDSLFMEASISTGLEDMPTPRGVFYIFEKTPSRYMQGPLPGISEQEYDLPGVPWTMYFTYQGAALHGAYWHNNFGERWSHGCVNLAPDISQKLYEWTDLGTKVTVKD